MQKEKPQIKILALRPSRRRMGVAVLEDEDLLYWGVMGLRKIPDDKVYGVVNRRIYKLIEDYEPVVIAVERPSKTRLNASPLLKNIWVQISSISVCESLDYHIISSERVLKPFCKEGIPTREKMAEGLIGRYEHLARYFNGATAWQKNYWMPMFTAVAVGLTCGSSKNP